MNTLLSCLYKEWRATRGALSAMLAIWAAVTLAASLLLPSDWVANGLVASRCGWGGVMLCALMLVADLVPSETRSGSIEMLRRTPGGLLPPFLAKTLVFLAASVGIGSGTLLCAHLGRSLVVETSNDTLHLLSPMLRDWSVAAIGIGCWGLAFSTWMRNGYLAFFCGALLTAPFLLWGRTPSRDLPPLLHSTIVPLESAFSLFLVMGLLTAGWSFCGLGHQGHVAMRRFGVATGATVAPLLGMVIYNLTPSALFQPGDQITGGLIGKGARYAFLGGHRGSRDWPYASVTVDLETGGWRVSNRRNESYRPAWPGQSFGLHSVLLRTSKTEAVYIDGRSCQELGELDGSMRPDVRARLRGSCAPAVSMPDGTGVWIHRKRLRFRKGDSEETVAWPNKHPPFMARGYGLLTAKTLGGKRTRWLVYDLIHRKLYPHLVHYGEVLILQDGWLVHEESCGWGFMDPENGDRRSVLADSCEVIAALGANSVLVRRSEHEPDAIQRWIFERVDILTGQAETMQWAKDLPPEAMGQRVPISIHRGQLISHCRTPTGRLVFPVAIGKPESKAERRERLRRHKPRKHLKFVTTLAPGATTFTRLIPANQALACLEDRWLIVIDPTKTRLQKVDIHTGETIALFPR